MKKENFCFIILLIFSNLVNIDLNFAQLKVYLHYEPSVLLPMKKSICIFLLSFFAISFVKSQTKVSNPLLLQTWKLISLDTYIYTYERRDVSDNKSYGIRFKENGKLQGSLPRPGSGNGNPEDISNKSLRFERYTGDWKKTSDSTLTITFPSNASMNGHFIISRLTSTELKLRKLFDPKTEKKMDSIRRERNILD
ncbi:hypothetical protein EGY07_17260 [Chryseobacterium indologenes]|uniref:Lipocalin-like domain-containing protein n=2 Tax=Chryseobacterium indologenes TaxID=253 RepID=A0AAD1DWM6_CHRID|nr:hypothetical protein CEQ15_21780 [Chryseobacterium indologenes]ATN03976.1 hypothetical protein CRN76_00265 [Chryseobacterium indologenes]AYY83359.1 hypothetical protein EGX91_01640 [Chryseobacterium indologenes]AYZ37168.1 hypothetical protein EGY07_17260 [Chryseobacterium indologenes]AZB19691.1 hypothetical protein EG352_18900 [Chryseobacterium indologenes]